MAWQRQGIERLLTSSIQYTLPVALFMTNLPALRLKSNQDRTVLGHNSRKPHASVSTRSARLSRRRSPRRHGTRRHDLYLRPNIPGLRSSSPPSRPGRSEHGWKPSRPSIPQKPVPHTRAPARKGSVGNPVHEGAISSHRLTQEEFKHRRSHTRAIHAHLAHSQGTYPRDVIVMGPHPPPAVVQLQAAVDLLISQERDEF